MASFGTKQLARGGSRYRSLLVHPYGRVNETLSYTKCYASLSQSMQQILHRPWQEIPWHHIVRDRKWNVTQTLEILCDANSYVTWNPMLHEILRDVKSYVLDRAAGAADLICTREWMLSAACIRTAARTEALPSRRASWSKIARHQIRQFIIDRQRSGFFHEHFATYYA